jgi:hypothetical protein
MKSQTRRLRKLKANSAAAAAAASIKQAGLNPRLMSKWADINLFRELNGRSDQVARRVTAIVDLCKKISDLTEEVKYGHTPRDKTRLNEWNKALLDLNARLVKFKWHPLVMAVMDTGSHFSVAYEFESRTADELFENQAVQWLMNNIDAIDRIRRCERTECGKWFFAIAAHQKYCHKECRQAVASRGEAFKEKRRRYMRVRRKEERNARLKKPN